MSIAFPTLSNRPFYFSINLLRVVDNQLSIISPFLLICCPGLHFDSPTLINFVN